MPKYKKLVMYGRFDNFHRGHEYAIEYALGLADQTMIVIWDDDCFHACMTAEQRARRQYGPLTQREKDVRDFIAHIKAGEWIEVVSGIREWTELPGVPGWADCDAILLLQRQAETDGYGKAIKTLAENRKAGRALEIVPEQADEKGQYYRSRRWHAEAAKGMALSPHDNFRSAK